MDSTTEPARGRASRSVAGKHILVTGTSTGIGATCVQELVNHGARVFAGVRSEEDFQASASISDRVTPLLMDVTDENAIASGAEQINATVGDDGLFGLVNNAGYAFACPLEFTPISQLRRQMEVNFIGQLAVTQSMLPMLRRARGRIVNITSLSGHVAGPYVGCYAASKHAFASLSDSLRLELRRLGVDVVQIIPGDIQTPIWTKSRTYADQLRDAIADDIASRLPIEVQNQYTADIQAMRKATDRFAQNALPVDRVVDAVIKSLTARRPRARYIVGARAWGAVHLLNRMPIGLRDWVVLRNLGMKS